MFLVMKRMMNKVRFRLVVVIFVVSRLVDVRIKVIF